MVDTVAIGTQPSTNGDFVLKPPFSEILESGWFRDRTGWSGRKKGSKTLYVYAVLAQRVTHLPRRQAQDASRFCLDPSGSFHGFNQSRPLRLRCIVTVLISYVRVGHRSVAYVEFGRLLNPAGWAGAIHRWLDDREIDTAGSLRIHLAHRSSQNHR